MARTVNLEKMKKMSNRELTLHLNVLRKDLKKARLAALECKIELKLIDKFMDRYINNKVMIDAFYKEKIEAQEEYKKNMAHVKETSQVLASVESIVFNRDLNSSGLSEQDYMLENMTEIFGETDFEVGQYGFVWPDGTTYYPDETTYGPAAMLTVLKSCVDPAKINIDAYENCLAALEDNSFTSNGLHEYVPNVENLNSIEYVPDLERLHSVFTDNGVLCLDINHVYVSTTHDLTDKQKECLAEWSEKMANAINEAIAGDELSWPEKHSLQNFTVHFADGKGNYSQYVFDAQTLKPGTISETFDKVRARHLKQNKQTVLNDIVADAKKQAKKQKTAKVEKTERNNKDTR